MNKVEREIEKILEAADTELLIELREFYLRGPDSVKYLSETYNDLKDSDDPKIQEIISKYYAPGKRMAFQHMEIDEKLMMEMLYVEMASIIKTYPELFE